MRSTFVESRFTSSAWVHQRAGFPPSGNVFRLFKPDTLDGFIIVSCSLAEPVLSWDVEDLLWRPISEPRFD